MPDPANQRRQLHFDNFDQVLRDAETLYKAEKTGKLRELGNWTFGQTCGHVAAWMNFAYDGVPIKVSWFTRMVARHMKKRYCNNPMNPGGSIPGAAGGTIAVDKLNPEDGLGRLRKAVARFKSPPQKSRHPVFGRMSGEEWTKLNLRHAELHLSFLRID